VKTRCLPATLAIAGASLCAAQSATAQKGTVTVCIEPYQSVLLGVRPLVSEMFASIGVSVDWQEVWRCGAIVA
jgi:hypothetical protein